MKKILFKAPVLTRSGYGEQSRFALRALRTRKDLDIYIQPLQWGKTGWLNDESEERVWIDQTIERTIQYIQSGGQFDVSLQVTIPNEWERLAPVNIGYTAGIETTAVAPLWLQQANNMNKIVVVSNHSKQVYERTSYETHNEQTGETQTIRVTTPITAVNYPVKLYENLTPLDLNLEYDFNFVCMAQMGPRKNVYNTIKWFVEEFHDEQVGLVVKTNIAKNCLMDREHVRGQIKIMLENTYPNRTCKVYLLHGDMSDEEVHALYLNDKIQAGVLLSHGEGFGLPLFEAAYSGIPVVTSGWSGQLDFLYGEDQKGHFYDVAFDLQPVPPEAVWENVITAESMWAYPRENSAKELMRQCYNDVINQTEGTHAVGAREYALELRERFEEQKMYKQFVDALGIEEEDFNVEGWLESLDIETIT
jgi:glycosyltransferase involved in cell wall biosynthesis